MRQPFDVVRTMRQKHDDKMKLQRWNLQYHRHMGGKTSEKVRCSTDFTFLIAVFPQLLLACSVTPSVKQHSPSGSLLLRKQKKRDHRSHTNWTGIIHLPNREVLHTQNSFLHPPITVHLAQDATQPGFPAEIRILSKQVKPRSSVKQYANAMIWEYGGGRDSLPDPKT